MTSFLDRKPAVSDRRALYAGVGALAFAALAGAVASPSPRRQAVPNARLLTHDGRRVRFYDDLVRDRIVVVNATYTTCSNVCPPATANLREVLRLLGPRAGRDVFLLSLTLLPEHDTPESLRTYRQHYQIGRGWTFLTGAPDDVRSVRVGLGLYDRDPAVDQDLTQHAAMLRIGNDAYDRWCMAPALAEPEQICEAIRAVDPHKRPIGHSRRWA